MVQEQALVGCRVLVVEDEFFLAQDLRRALERSGAQVIGPVGNLVDAMRQVMAGGFEVAVVDLNLRGQMAYSIARELRQQDVPFVFATGYDRSDIPAEFANVKIWERPFEERQLVADLARFCSRAHP